MSRERDGRPVSWFGLPAGRGFRSLAGDERDQVVVALLLGRPLPRHLAPVAPVGNIRLLTWMVHASLAFGLIMLGLASRTAVAGTTPWWGQALEWFAVAYFFTMAAMWASAVSRARRGISPRRPLRHPRGR